jgi:acyl-CoA thioester hydrolase
MGVAHHASYIPWLEVGRTELLRDCGITYAALEASGTFLVIVKLDVRYRRPVKYDDLVEVRTHWTGGSKIKIEHAYELVVMERGHERCEHVAAVGSTTLACVDKHGKIQPLPQWLATRGA